MPRHSVRCTHLEPYQRALAAMIDDALRRGQRGDGEDPKHWTRWTNRSFAAKAVVAENSVANWRNPDLLMPPEDIMPLLKVFYGVIDRFKDEKAKMKRLWQLARGYVDDDGPSDRSWLPGKPQNLQGAVKLVHLREHAPVPGNDGSMRLSLTLVITPEQDATYDKKGIVIGLMEALLCMNSEHWQATRQSFVSERGHPNFRLSAAGARIVGPVDDATGMIDGQPLGEDELAVVEPVGSGEGPIQVAVHAARGSFRVLAKLPGGTTKHVSRTQDAVLNALLYDQYPDRDGVDRVILAQATIQPRPA